MATFVPFLSACTYESAYIWGLFLEIKERQKNYSVFAQYAKNETLKVRRCGTLWLKLALLT